MAGVQRLLGQVICISTRNSGFFLSGKTSVLPTVKPWIYEPEFYRFSHTFLSRVTAEQLWKSVTSVSNAGRKKGRGKGTGKKLSKDLNKGQVIGFGPKNMLWPGLNAPVVRGKEVLTHQELPPDKSREQRIIEMRDKMVGIKSFKVHPLERGWSGNKLPGRSLGPPDPIGDEMPVKKHFADISEIQLNTTKELNAIPAKTFQAAMNTLCKQTSIYIKNQGCILNCYGYASSNIGQTAATRARNRAAQALRYIKLYEDHTVLHDFHSSFGAVVINVKKMPKGYGLVCHRVIRAICEMVGIKDLYAKVKGPTDNIHCVVKAFFIGLMRQQTHQELADKVGLHLVELRNERDFFPQVVASPEDVRSEEEIGLHEPIDYELVVHNNKVLEPVKEYKPFYIEFESYKKKLRDSERFRNHDDVKRQLVAKYGKLASFLTIREEQKEKQTLKDTVEEKSD